MSEVRRMVRAGLAGRMNRWITEFYNNCHDSDGRFCDTAATKGTDTPKPGHRAYWLSSDGKFVPFDTHLDAIQDANVSGAQEASALHAVFARREKAVRLSIEKDSADVEVWGPMTEEQIAAMASNFKGKAVVNIESHNRHIPDDENERYVPNHDQTLLRPDSEELYKKLEIANLHVKGRKISDIMAHLTLKEAEEFYNHAHDTKGRFAESPEGRAAKSMQEAIEKQGGFTVHPFTGKSPTTGYQVGVDGRTMTPTPTKDEFLHGDPKKLKAQIKNWLKQNADIFASNPQMHVGGWLDTNTGLVHLDPSLYVKDKKIAKSLGQKQNQIAIWDNANGVEISTGGKGSARR